MSTIIIHHDDCLRHNPGPKHPESPLRIKAVLAGLEGLRGLEKLPAPRATAEQIARVHPQAFWADITAKEPAEGIVSIDVDTFLSSGSVDAALRASGALCFAIDQILDNRTLRAFCAVRPPGHHSEQAVAMGFCLLNHVAVGAMHALERPEIKRVAIIDFDVHHGNGTQAIFEQNPDVMYVSSHQLPLYPGTGLSDETGCGNILNLPMAPGDGGKPFRRTWGRTGLPAIKDFAPDLILISAGFDAHVRDPLAQIELEDADYHWITDQLCDIADDCCGGRVASILEGGYDLEALAGASRAHVQALAS